MADVRKILKGRCGSVMMEAVIVMPILLFLIFLIIQFAHIWTAKQMVSYAAFCATRAITVVNPDEQNEAALNAAKMALSWMCLADGGEGDDGEDVTVPGWGKIPGARSAGRRVVVEIATAKDKDGNKVVLDGQASDYPVAAVKVTFSFPLLIPGMAVNSVLATAATGGGRDEEETDDVGRKYDFARNLNRAAGNPSLINGWPYLELTETCVLPMPYSTVKFPSGGFAECSLK